MKKLMFLLFISSTINTFCQEFRYDKNGLNPEYSVIVIDSLSKETLYNKSINWIKETYVNPDVVIKTSIENEMIRFSGVKKNYFTKKGLGIPFFFDFRYTIVMEFKDGKIKFEPTYFEQYVDGGKYSIGDWYYLNPAEQGYYKKNGEIRKSVAEYGILIPKLMNELMNSLHNYIINKTDSKKKDW